RRDRCDRAVAARRLRFAFAQNVAIPRRKLWETARSVTKPQRDEHSADTRLKPSRHKRDRALRRPIIALLAASALVPTPALAQASIPDEGAPQPAALPGAI